MRKVKIFFKVVFWSLVVLWAAHLIGFACKRDVDRVMPRWPLAYVRMDDPAAAVRTLMRLPGFDAGVLAGVHGNTTAAEVSKFIIRCMAGRRAAVGLYHSVKAEERVDVLGVFDLGYLAEYVIRGYFALLSVSDDPMVEHWQGVNILHAGDETDTAFFVTQRGGKVYVSNDAYWIKRALSQRGFSPLRDSEFHKTFMQSRPARTMFAAYADTARIAQFMILNEARFLQAKAFLDPLIKDGITSDGFSRISLFGFSKSKRSIDLRLAVDYDYEELSYVVSRYFERDPKENHTFAYVPQSVEAYAWAGNVSPAYFWVLWANSVGEERYAAIRQKFFEKTGLDIEKDVIEALGYEYGFFGDVHGKLPRGVAFLAVKDGKAINRALDLLKTQTMHTQEYRGRTLQVYDDFTQAFGVKPAYMLEGGRLWFATDISALTDVIDTKDKQRDDFTKNMVFAPDRLRVNDTSHAWCYAAISRAVDNGVRMLHTFAAQPPYAEVMRTSLVNSGVAPAQWETFKREYAQPLLSVLRGIESAVFRLHTTDGRFTADVHLFLAPQSKQGGDRERT
jgi:hypothetical protein